MRYVIFSAVLLCFGLISADVARANTNAVCTETRKQIASIEALRRYFQNEIVECLAENPYNHDVCEGWGKPLKETYDALDWFYAIERRVC